MIPELQRLGVWDILRGWTGRSGEALSPRLALQLINEAALCVSGKRESRCLSQKGFEVANGLPFVVSDVAVHRLLAGIETTETLKLQVALGRLRQASGHFKGKLLAIDPHRISSFSKRQMARQRPKPELKARKTAQTFFCIDADTSQPVCFTLSSSSRSAARATPELLRLSSEILNVEPGEALVLADSEHFGEEILTHVLRDTPFDILTPQPNYQFYKKEMMALPEEAFERRWAGFATAGHPFGFKDADESPFWRIIQRTGEDERSYRFKGFVCTTPKDGVDAAAREYPRRWRAEEFFNKDQALGWRKAGTLNLNVRYGRMTMALVAQAAIHQLRERLGDPFRNWDAAHLAADLFQGLDGDIRVDPDEKDTIIVTYYNAGELAEARGQLEKNVQALQRENVDPRIPWLYGFKLNFRFK